jgi:iron complex transport system substrate-binding protein
MIFSGAAWAAAVGRRAVVAALLLVLCWPLSSALADEEKSADAGVARIVSLSPQLTENIFLLGAGDRLVGVTLYCFQPEAARSLVQVGSVQEIHIEKIAALRPQLILASDMTSPQQLATLRRLGFRVETFSRTDSFAAICSDFLRLGQLLGLSSKARDVVTWAQRQVDLVQKAVAPFPRRKVLLQVGAQPLFASVPGSFTHDFIELAGGFNIVGDRRSGAISVEQVLALNPEVILISVMGSESGVGKQEQLRWLRFAKTLRAAQTRQVYALPPEDICSPSPQRFARTLIAVARLIHPEAAGALPQP